MGLRATITVDGVPLGYHRISYLGIEVNQGNCITVMSYISQEERDKEDEPGVEQPYRAGWFAQTDYDPDMSVNTAYKYLKTLAEFEDAEDVIDNWAPDRAYAMHDEAMYEEKQYRCIQAHTSQVGWEPPKVPALWQEHGGGGTPEWKQPTGASDAYMKGDEVKHNGKTWRSEIDANVWEPGVYGWAPLD